MARMEMSPLQEAELAAKAGSDEAFYRLGLIYSTGRDVEADLVSAHKWFNLAALKGNQNAREYRKELSLVMSGEEVSEAQRRAREWLQNA